jgi:hypothetical protein
MSATRILFMAQMTGVLITLSTQTTEFEFLMDSVLKVELPASMRERDRQRERERDTHRHRNSRSCPKYPRSSGGRPAMLFLGEV